jgi:nucleotide-binding universal stress UspA family protein
MVATDGSKGANRAVDVAAELAKALAGDLLIATVADNPTIRLKTTAAMIFQERRANQRMTKTLNIAVKVSRNALCRITEN